MSGGPPAGVGLDLARLVCERRIIVCCGSGGVGKTTVSAAIALEAAIRGKRAAVLTIDPARRLASSLGLERLDNEERRIPDAMFRDSGLEARGELWAAMLDTKRTFDALIERYSPTAEIRERILGNRLYQNLSNALAGSHEYMAMERLFELHHKGDYDLLVLDTPPTTQALDFLEAPKRITDFVGSQVIQRFLRPYFIVGRLGMKAVRQGMGRAFQLIEKLTGLEVVAEIADFFELSDQLYDGFKERAVHVFDLLRSPQTAFLLVTSPARHSIAEIFFFYEKFVEYGMPFAGFVVNMVHHPFVTDRSQKEALRELDERFSEARRDPSGEIESDRLRLLESLRRNLVGFERLAALDGESIAALRKQTGQKRLAAAAIPLLDEDVHDIAGLAKLNEHLFPR